jgi:hypothetical protein
MRTLFLCNKTGILSGRLLFKQMFRDKPSRERMIFRCFGSIPRHFDNVVRFGRRDNLTSPYNDINFGLTTYNNKYEELQKLSLESPLDDGKVIVPSFSMQPLDTFPQIRRTLNHFGGNGFTLIEDSSSCQEPDDNHFFIKYIDKDCEYRIHCGIDSNNDFVVLRRQRKVPRELNHDTIRCNGSRGWGLSPIDTAPPNVVGAAKRAILRLGLDFCAVDVLLKGHKAYVVECNTAPGLNYNTVKGYSDLILRKLYGT